MWHCPLNLFTVSFVLFLVYPVHECSYVSEEHETNIPTFDVVVVEGKRLELRVDHDGHRSICNPQWYHNGRLIAKSRCVPSYGKLVCPAVSRYDAGRYDLWAGDGSRDSQPELIFSAYVLVTKETVPVAGEPSTSPRELERPIAYERPPHREWDDCFCSGVTGRCWMATDLYRTLSSYNLSRALKVQPHPEDVDGMGPSSSSWYLMVPGSVWDGNLITSYGGYLRFPATDECVTDRDQPCVIMRSKRNVMVGLFLTSQHNDQGRHQVHALMKESHWRLISPENRPLDTAELDKFTFMTILSNLNAVYIRGKVRGRDDTLIVEMATPHDDDGLGRVTTVEECHCHPGYAGLSCERCDKGFIRVRGSINTNGLCISGSELWRMHKRWFNID